MKSKLWILYCALRVTEEIKWWASAEGAAQFRLQTVTDNFLFATRDFGGLAGPTLVMA